MPVTWLKRGIPETERVADDAKVRATVTDVLHDIQTRGRRRRARSFGEVRQVFPPVLPPDPI